MSANAPRCLIYRNQRSTVTRRGFKISPPICPLMLGSSNLVGIFAGMFKTNYLSDIQGNMRIVGHNCINQPTPSLVCKGENGITDLQANVLQSIPKIESINLERNAIKSIHPQAFSGAKQLMLLNLYGNRITNLPPRAFQVKG